MILGSAHGKAAARLPLGGEADYRARNADEQGALLDLARTGFVKTVDGPDVAWRWCGHSPASDGALLALLARFDLHLEVGLAEDEAVWVAAAIQEHAGEDARHAFSGTGFRPEEAIRACLGEFAEFQSWLYRPGDTGQRCDRHRLGHQAIDPWDILGFAPAQLERRLEFNAAWQGYDAIPAPDAFEGILDWTAATILNGGTPYWLPSQLCFGRYGARAACVDKDWHGDSNGCAAGPTRQQALAHSLLELVERDATGIWWYGCVRRPALPRSLFDDDALCRALAARERMGHIVRLLDLTHDLEIPVVASLIVDEDGNLSALGFGCDIDRERAARSAYREMCQTELSIAFARRRVAQAGEAARPEDRRLLDWLAGSRQLAHLQPDGARRLPNRTSDVEAVPFVSERMRRAGLAAYVVDMERPDIGVPALRAFVPGLCHFKPRLGFKRLIEVPRALRWRDAGFGPQDLGEVPLLI